MTFIYVMVSQETKKISNFSWKSSENNAKLLEYYISNALNKFALIEYKKEEEVELRLEVALS